MFRNPYTPLNVGVVTVKFVHVTHEKCSFDKLLSLNFYDYLILNISLFTDDYKALLAKYLFYFQHLTLKEFILL